jgi:hypothetical protein
MRDSVICFTYIHVVQVGDGYLTYSFRQFTSKSSVLDMLCICVPMDSRWQYEFKTETMLKIRQHNTKLFTF